MAYAEDRDVDEHKPQHLLEEPHEVLVVEVVEDSIVHVLVLQDVVGDAKELRSQLVLALEELDQGLVAQGLHVGVALLHCVTRSPTQEAQQLEGVVEDCVEVRVTVFAHPLERSVADQLVELQQSHDEVLVGHVGSPVLVDQLLHPCVADLQEDQVDRTRFQGPNQSDNVSEDHDDGVLCQKKGLPGGPC